MEPDKHSSISNSGNLSVQQSSPFVHGDGDDNDDDDDEVQGLIKRLSFSSASSSSFNSPSGNPFEEDNVMKTSPANDGVHDQGLSKKFSKSSSLSSSSSSDSLFEGNFGIDEELRDKDSENLMMQHFPSTVDEVDHQNSKKSSRSTTSSPDSPLNGPFGGGNEKGKDTSIGNLTVQPSPDDVGKQPRSLPELDHKAAVKDGKNGNPVSKNLPPKSEFPVPDSPTDSPPTQVMERTTKPKYRIPSHVFARNKSGNPDWSVASDDSLFSIHMDNLSFTRDSELFSIGETSSAPGPLPGEPSNQQTGNKATNGVEVAKENETDKMSIPVGQISHHPQESSISNKSFAFPVLADGDKSPLVSSGDSSRSSSRKERSDSQKVSSPKNPESSEEAEQPEVKEAVGAQPGPGAPWLSSLPCCS